VTSSEGADAPHEDNFVPEVTALEWVKLTGKAKAAPGAPVPVPPVHPADDDLMTFADFKEARAQAKKHSSPTDFAAADSKCTVLRNAATVTCGVKYCKANAVCGKPCKHKWGGPPTRVMPKQPGGPMFYKLQFGAAIEKSNKEKRTKEIQAKSAAHKERSAKNLKFEARVGQEKAAKTKSVADMDAKEDAMKKIIKKELQSKKAEMNKQVKTMTRISNLTCVKMSVSSFQRCELKVAAEAAEKLASKQAIIDAAANISKTENSTSITKGDVSEAVQDLEAAKVEAQKEADAASAQADQITGEISYGGSGSTSANEGSSTSQASAEAQGSATSNDAAAASASAAVDPLQVAETCSSDDKWIDGDGNTCADLDRAYCTSHTTAVNGKTPQEACCECKVVAAEGSTCVSDAAWKNDGANPDAPGVTLTCASSEVDSDWCSKYGEEVYPGHGCKIDGSDCKSAKNACCQCKSQVVEVSAPSPPALMNILEPASTTVVSAVEEIAVNKPTVHQATGDTQAGMDARILRDLVDNGVNDGYGDVDALAAVVVPAARRLLSKSKSDATLSYHLGPSPAEAEELQTRLNNARAATEKLATKALEKMAAAHGKVANATIAVDKDKNAHLEDMGIATDIFSKAFRSALTKKAISAEAEISENQAWIDSYNEQGEHTCAEKKTFLYRDCFSNATVFMKKQVDAMSADAEKKHIEYGNKAAAAAASMGESLELKMAAGKQEVKVIDEESKLVKKSIKKEKAFVPKELLDPFDENGMLKKPAKKAVSSAGSDTSTETSGQDDAESGGSDTSVGGSDAGGEVSGGSDTSVGGSDAGGEVSGGSDTSGATGGDASGSAVTELLQLGSGSEDPIEKAIEKTEVPKTVASNAKDCELARDQAYGECRATQNEAYKTCAKLFSGEAKSLKSSSGTSAAGGAAKSEAAGSATSAKPSAKAAPEPEGSAASAEQSAAASGGEAASAASEPEGSATSAEQSAATGVGEAASEPEGSATSAEQSAAGGEGSATSAEGSATSAEQSAVNQALAKEEAMKAQLEDEAAAGGSAASAQGGSVEAPLFAEVPPRVETSQEDSMNADSMQVKDLEDA
jgi:hypothetical protein